MLIFGGVPFQMAFHSMAEINGGDPNYLLITGMILQVALRKFT